MSPPLVVPNPSATFLIDRASRCSASLRIICPFVTSPALRRLAAVTGRLSSGGRQLLTRADDRAAAHGALDYEALRQWVHDGGRLRVAPRSLHAKVLLFDDLAALVTSANLTNGGLGANTEIGLYTEDPSAVVELVRLFDGYWTDAGPDVTESEVAALRDRLTAISANLAPVLFPPDFHDHGRQTRKVNQPATTFAPLGRNHDGRAVYLKMYAQSHKRVSPNERMSETPQQWGGVTFSDNRALRPTPFQAGDLVYICWLVEDDRKLVGARGVVERRWDPNRDSAPPALRQIAPDIAKWPHVLWLMKIEVLACRIGDAVDFDEVINAIGSETFMQSQGKPGGAAAARKVFQSQRSHPRLTEAAAQNLGERFERIGRSEGIAMVPVGTRTWWERIAPGRFQKQ